MIVYRGIIIENSISTVTLGKLKSYVVRTYYHLLDKKYATNIMIVVIPETELEYVLDLIKSSIYTSYYAHFVYNDIMYVVFCGEVCKLTRYDISSIEFCKSRGREHGIDDNLMKFELMFERDHPND